MGTLAPNLLSTRKALYKAWSYFRCDLRLRRNVDMLAVSVTVLYHSLVAFGIIGLGLDAKPTDLWISTRPFLGRLEAPKSSGEMYSRRSRPLFSVEELRNPLLVSRTYRLWPLDLLLHLDVPARPPLGCAKALREEHNVAPGGARHRKSGQSPHVSGPETLSAV